MGFLFYLTLAAASLLASPSALLLPSVIVGLFLAVAKTTHPSHTSPRIVLAPVFVAFLARLLWILAVPTQPISDFSTYNDLGLALSHGSAPSYLGNNLGYPLVLSFVYRISPHTWSAMLINALAGAGTCALMYALGVRLENPTVGLLAAWVFALLPSSVAMSSVIGVDEAATSIVLLTILVSLEAARADHIGPLQGCSGFLMAGSVLLWSTAWIAVPLVLYLVFRKHERIGERLSALLIWLGGAVAALCIAVAFYSLTLGRFSLDPVRPHDALPLLAGTNISSQGMWNEEDADLYQSWPINVRNRLALDEAWQRVSSAPLGFASIIPAKLAILLADDTYAEYWSVESASFGITRDSDPLQRMVSTYAGFISQSIYVALLALAILAFVLDASRPLRSLTLAIMACAILSYVFLEVQPRYHHELMPFLTMLGAAGAQALVRAL